MEIGLCVCSSIVLSRTRWGSSGRGDHGDGPAAALVRGRQGSDHVAETLAPGAVTSEVARRHGDVAAAADFWLATGERQAALWRGRIMRARLCASGAGNACTTRAPPAGSVTVIEIIVWLCGRSGSPGGGRGDALTRVAQALKAAS